MKYVASHGTVRAMVQTGERPLGIQMLNDAMKSVTAGEPASFVLAQEGSPAEITAASILKASRNPAEAKAFVDFLLTEKGQDMMVKLGGCSRCGRTRRFKFPDGRGVADVKVVPLDLAYITPEKRRGAHPEVPRDHALRRQTAGGRRPDSASWTPVRRPTSLTGC